MSLRRVLAAMTAAVALIAGVLLAGTASAASDSGRAGFSRQAVQAGLSTTQAAELQQKVDRFLARDTDWRQVSANRILTDGGSVTLALPGEEKARNLNATAGAQLACNHGHLCITDGDGDHWDYYYCGYYDFYGVGDGTFNNNQTWGTTARFYNYDGSVRWMNTAKDSGTASWTPVWHIRPC